jgi:hypothetical protein
MSGEGEFDWSSIPYAAVEVGIVFFSGVFAASCCGKLFPLGFWAALLLGG